MREYADRGPSGTDNRFCGFVFSGRRATAGTSTARRSRTRRTELGPDAHKAIARQMRDYFLGQTHWPPLASGIRIVVYRLGCAGSASAAPASAARICDWGDQVAGAWLDK